MRIDKTLITLNLCGGTLIWGPYNKDPTIWGTILQSPIFGNSHVPGHLSPTERTVHLLSLAP